MKAAPEMAGVQAAVDEARELGVVRHHSYYMVTRAGSSCAHCDVCAEFREVARRG